jgi:protocatechuate 3,4-dioxygenase beta subunit
MKKTSTKPENRHFTRRDVMTTLLAVGAGAAAGCSSDAAAPPVSALQDAGRTGLVDAMGMPMNALSCILTPSLDQGPFFVDENLNRADLLAGETDPGITSGRQLGLRIGVYGVKDGVCRPMTGAHVDIWHADVNGLYSDTASGFIQSTDTVGKKFLRGYQVVPEDGEVAFTTIYPGWYLTRTIHIHLKIRLYSSTGDVTLDAVTQMFFDDAVTDVVFAQGSYLNHGVRSIPKNTNDEIFNGTGVGRAIDNVGPAPGQASPGEMTIASISPTPSGGLEARLKVGVQLS